MDRRKAEQLPTCRDEPLVVQKLLKKVTKIAISQAQPHATKDMTPEPSAVRAVQVPAVRNSRQSPVASATHTSGIAIRASIGSTTPANSTRQNAIMGRASTPTRQVVCS